MKPLAHGSPSTYVNHRCRCDECRAAWLESCRQQKDSRLARMAAGEVVLPHGRLSTYNNWGCRCEDCKRAASVKNARRYH